jgi:choline-glycine betaine transporter
MCIGVDTSGMATQGYDAVEAAVRRGLVPLCTLSGVLVVTGFFFPGFVGSVIPGEAWLVAALLFFGSGLAFLALLPVDDPETGTGTDESPRRTAPYLLRVRHLSPVAAVRAFLARQDPATFGVPVAVLALFFAAEFVLPAATGRAVGSVREFLLNDLGWLFLGVMFLCVCYCLFLLVGPWGDVRLGGPDAEPTYTYPTYFAMFFTAGIAAGIVFWGPAEALFHYQTPPPYFDVPPGSDAAVVAALTYALFHWGLSAWSAYLVVGIPIAYFTYQRGAPLRVSTILAPFLGVDGLRGRWATLVDVLAVFATIGGIATSIAFVSRQFLAGIGFQWGVAYGHLGPVVFVAGLTLIYVVSAESGVERGIRRIAAVTLALFALFGLLLAGVGPRDAVVETGTAALGSYVVNFVPMSLFFDGPWVAAWTVWNWSWWFSWAPFAGLFLAALSRGRRIRTVVLTGGVATSAATAVWFLLFGGTSLSLQRSGRADVLATIEAYGGSEAVAGFPILAVLPLDRLLVFLFLALIVVFIVSSADTSTLVVAILATRRDLAPTSGSILFWGLVQGAVAVAVLLVGGGEALQAAAVLTGGPFALLALVALAGLTLTLSRREGFGRPWLPWLSALPTLPALPRDLAPDHPDHPDPPDAPGPSPDPADDDAAEDD